LVQVAVFPLTMLAVTVRVPLLARPPPPAVHSPLPVLVQVAVFPLTVLFVTVRVPLLDRPPPRAKHSSLPVLVQLLAPPVIVTPEIVAVTPELTVMTRLFAPVASMIVLPASAPVSVRFVEMLSGKVSPKAVL
jgi:hypothetical protein